MSFCTKCILKKGHPGTEFNALGECSFCSGSSIATDYVEKYTTIMKNYERFISSPANSKGDYDGLIMFSGGKDSMYMLHKLKTETSMRFLAFTYNIPYESKNAIHNMQEFIKLIDIDYVTFSSSASYKRLMKNVFLSGKQNNSLKAEKTPCVICSCYMILSACFMALNFKIPYVLYCADPMQMLGIETDLKKIIQIMADYLGWDFLTQLLGDKVSRLRDMAPKDLPIIVFPYVTMMNSYNKAIIIKELEKMGKLFPSSMGTMCSLYPILEYYAFKNYDCCIDSLEFAISVRKGIVPREILIQYISAYKKIVMELLVKEQLTEQDKSIIRNLTMKAHPDSEADAKAMYNSIVLFRSVAEELGILDDLIKDNENYKKIEEENFLRSLTQKIEEDF